MKRLDAIDEAPTVNPKTATSCLTTKFRSNDPVAKTSWSLNEKSRDSYFRHTTCLMGFGQPDSGSFDVAFATFEIYF